MKRIRLALLSALVAAAWGPAALAQSTPSPAAAESQARQGVKHGGNLKRAERKFLENAAMHNLAEVQAGKLAESKAASPDAKKFGQQMAQDHNKAYEEVMQLAKSKSITLPSEPDRGHKREAAKLEKLSGADFDRRYMDSMVKDHQKDVKEFRKMAKNARDPDVKAWAEKTVPVLEGHLQMARQVAGETSGARQHQASR